MTFLAVRTALLFSAAAFAETPRVELGVQLSGLNQKVLGEYPVGAGGRFTLHVLHFVDAEAEVNRYPIGGGTAVFPATDATFGARIGRRLDSFGIYGKLGPGFVRYDANQYVPDLGLKPVLYFGGVIEFYSRKHIAARMDLGDTVVWYGSNTRIPPISAPGPSTAAGIRHQLKWGIGVSLWF